MNTRRYRPTPSHLAALVLVTPAALANAAGDDRGLARWFDDSGTGACLHSRLESFVGMDEAKTRDGTFDPATGRSLLNYPPHLFADFQHIKLDISIPDMNVPRFDATATISIAPIAQPLERLDLNAALLKVKRVTIAGADIPFDYDGERLSLRFPSAIAVGQKTDIRVEYSIDDPPAGIYWTPSSPAWPGRPPQLHSQGEPETNRFWFPCHDFPNDRLTTEIVVTVPEGFVACSNGHLVSREKNAPGTETFHWLQDKPHAAYLVSLVVGKFDVVDVGSEALPLPVYAPLGKGGQVQQTYGATARMIDVFTSIVEEPFPWDKYAQVVVWNFSFGGMENTSATTMYDTAILDKTSLQDGDLDGLISHELAHQWFGDLLTCNSWEHIWLNEGFATYFTHLWFESRDGIDAYLFGVYNNRQGLIEKDHAEAPFVPGMVSKEYKLPFDTFQRAANPYPKGAFILHMLRVMMTDPVFRSCLIKYVHDHRQTTVETYGFRETFEEVSGKSLERFFSQWAYRPGVPKVTVTPRYDAATKELVVKIDQTQPIDGANPAFAFDLPIYVKDGSDSEFTVLSAFTDQRSTEARFPMKREPASLVIDPEMAVLADYKVEQPVERWARQLADGPTVPARLQAIDALAAPGSSSASIRPEELLTKTIRNNDLYYAVRCAALGGLRKLGAEEALWAFADRLPDDARIRKAVVEAVGGLGEDKGKDDARLRTKVAEFLRDRAERDTSYACRASAIRSLGKLKATEMLATIVGASGMESQHDQVRQSALESLADLDRPEGLAVAMRIAQPGFLARTRPVAIDTVEKLSHHNFDAAYAFLVSLLSDREDRTRAAAGAALARMGDPRATPVLEAYLKSRRTNSERVMTSKWIKELAEAIPKKSAELAEARAKPAVTIASAETAAALASAPAVAPAVPPAAPAAFTPPAEVKTADSAGIKKPLAPPLKLAQPQQAQQTPPPVITPEEQAKRDAAIAAAERAERDRMTNAAREIDANRLATETKRAEEARAAAQVEGDAAEARAKAEAQAKAIADADVAKFEAQAKHEAELRKQADQAREEQAQKLRAEVKAREEAEAKARDAAARADAETKARLESEAKMKADAAAMATAKAAADAQAKTASEEKARSDAEAKAAAEAIAKKDVEARTKAEADALAKSAADAKARAEADAKSKAEAEAKLKAETDARLKAEAEAKANAAALAKAETEAKTRAETEAKLKLEAEALVKAEAAARAKAETEAKARAEAEAKMKIEAEALAKAEAAARVKAEAEAKARAENEAARNREVAKLREEAAAARAAAARAEAMAREADARAAELTAQRQKDVEEILAAERAKLALDAKQAPKPLAPQAPAAPAVEPDAKWFKLRRIDDWVISEDNRKILQANPADYFRQGGYVVESFGGDFYMLLWNTPSRSLATESGKPASWSVSGAYESTDNAGRSGAAFMLDDAGGVLMGELTDRNIGRRIAVLVADEVYIAPTIQSRIGRSGMITGRFLEGEVQSVVHEMGRSGGLSFRVAVEPGQMPDEAALREAIKKNGPQRK